MSRTDDNKIRYSTAAAPATYDYYYYEDPEPPFDEPPQLPLPKLKLAAKNKNDNDGDDDDLLSWTGSELDIDNDAGGIATAHVTATDYHIDEREDEGYIRSKSKNPNHNQQHKHEQKHNTLHQTSIEQRDDGSADHHYDEVLSIHWSGSDLDDVNEDVDVDVDFVGNDGNIDVVDQRDDENSDDGIPSSRRRNRRDGYRDDECREEFADENENTFDDKFINDTSHAVMMMRKIILADVEREIEIDKKHTATNNTTSNNNDTTEQQQQQQQQQKVVLLEKEENCYDYHHHRNGGHDIAIRASRSIDSELVNSTSGQASVTTRIRNTKNTVLRSFDADNSDFVNSTGGQSSVTARIRNTKNMCKERAAAVVPGISRVSAAANNSVIDCYCDDSTTTGATDTDTETTMGGEQQSVMTSDLQQQSGGAGVGGSKLLQMGGCGSGSILQLGPKKKTKEKQKSTTDITAIRALSRDEEEDLLDRFFENLQNQVCKTDQKDKNGNLSSSGSSSSSREEEDRKPRVFDPFLDRLEKVDPVFERLEGFVCPEGDGDGDGNGNGERNMCGNLNEKLVKTPVAYAAAKFSELLDRVETFDQCFANMEEREYADYDNPKVATAAAYAETITKSDEASEAAQQEFGRNINNNTDIDSTGISATMEKGRSNELPFEMLDKAYERAETMIIKRKETSFSKKDQLEKMKEQWFSARLNFKLRQSILAEAVKQSTVKAAKVTTKYVDSVVGSCTEAGTTVTATEKPTSLDEEKKDKNKNSKLTKEKLSISTKGQEEDDDISSYGGSEATSDEASIDDSDFFSVGTPSLSVVTQSEHSAMMHTGRGFRSLAISSPSVQTNFTQTSRDESAMTNLSYSDHVVRSPHCLSPESRNADSIANFSDGVPSDEEDEVKNKVDAKIGISSGSYHNRLAVITEEVNTIDSAESHTAKNNRKKKERKRRKRSKLSSRSRSISPSSSSRTNFRWGYPQPGIPAFNSSELLEKWRETVESVYTVSERFLDRTACSSSSINLSASNSSKDRKTNKKSTAPRVKRQNSIIENEDVGIPIEKEINDYGHSYGDSFDDNLSGFQTALNTFDSEPTDERPPMLRLQRSRHDSRSYGSCHSKSETPKKNCAQSRLSTELPKGYTLADSIRHASILSGNGRRASREPRGSKSKRDPSVHVRSNVPMPVLLSPEKPKQDPESNPELQQKIRSPRSSETEHTELTAQTTSDFEEINSGSKDPMTIFAVARTGTSTPEERLEDDKGTVFSVRADSFMDCMSRATIGQDVSNDEDNDVDNTVFSAYTTSSDSFKDCYEDAIPSLSTMATIVVEDDATSPVNWDKNVSEEQSNTVSANTTFLSSRASTPTDLVKSMAMLSVSAVVLCTTPTRHQKDKHNSEILSSIPRTGNVANVRITEQVKDPDGCVLGYAKDPDEQAFETAEYPEERVMEGEEYHKAPQMNKASDAYIAHSSDELSEPKEKYESEAKPIPTNAAANQIEVVSLEEKIIENTKKEEERPASTTPLERKEQQDTDEAVLTLSLDEPMEYLSLKEGNMGNIIVEEEEVTNADTTSLEQKEESVSILPMDEAMKDISLQVGNVESIIVEEEEEEEATTDRTPLEPKEQQDAEEVVSIIQLDDKAKQESCFKEDVVEDFVKEEEEAMQESSLKEDIVENFVIEEESDVDDDTINILTRIPLEPKDDLETEKSTSTFFKTVEDEGLGTATTRIPLESRDDDQETISTFLTTMEEEKLVVGRSTSKIPLQPRGDQEPKTSFSTFFKGMEELDVSDNQITIPWEQKSKDEHDDEPEESLSNFLKAIEGEEVVGVDTDNGESLLEPKDEHETEESVSTILQDITPWGQQSKDEHDDAPEESLSTFLKAMEEEEVGVDTDNDESLLEPKEEHETEESISTILQDIIMEDGEFPLQLERKEPQQFDGNSNNNKQLFQLEDSYYFNESGTIKKPTKRKKQRYHSRTKHQQCQNETGSGNGDDCDHQPLTVEDRRQRRLRQRRKFEKVLRGEDDSSASSSLDSTCTSYSGSNQHQIKQCEQQPVIGATATEETDDYNGPLISASFDTTPVIQE